MVVPDGGGALGPQHHECHLVTSKAVEIGVEMQIPTGAVPRFKYEELALNGFALEGTALGRFALGVPASVGFAL